MRTVLIATLTVAVASIVAAQVGPEGYENPSCNGKQVIVHLFEWKWTDIALECERFLSQNDFCGVQVSPPQEHIVIPEGTELPPYPWWQRYQVVSYKLESTSGSEAEFMDMVQRCNAVGVRVFADSIFNHMTGVGSSGVGSGGTPYDSDAYDFPGVPYGPEDFTPREMCNSIDGTVTNNADPENVRNCMLYGLLDLYGASDDVRQKVSTYHNKLIDMGVAGFRVDVAKHMWPEDILAIQELTKDLNTAHGFPAGTRPFFYHEVLDRNDGAITVQEYYGLGRITEFRYCQNIAWSIVGDMSELDKLYNPDIGMTQPSSALVFVDNHDNQRGHGGAGDTLTFKYPKEYRLGTAFTLAQTYGFTRIMSSYDFGTDTDAGPPHNADYSTSDVVIGPDEQCEGDWVCEHRWPSITKMVRFRNAVASTDSWSNYYNDGNIVAFSRGTVGFFAMIKSGTFTQTMQTGMPAGTYQELLTCSDVTVNSDGTASISITNEQEPVFAICSGCVC